MSQGWDGIRNPSEAEREALKVAVREAVHEALRGMNFVDVPTHVAHHHEIERMLALKAHAQRVGVGVLITSMVTGLIGLFVIGIGAWIKNLGAGR